METETAAPAAVPAPAPTPPSSSALTDVAAWLTDEIAETHAAVMGVHKIAAEDEDPKLQLDCMKAAARMMQAQAVAAISLQRLMGGKGQTVTIVHEKRNTPPPEKSKTNGRYGNVKEISEDDLYEEDLAWRKAHGLGPPRFRIIEVVDDPERGIVSSVVSEDLAKPEDMAKPDARLP